MKVKNINWKNVLLSFLLVAAVIALFTFIDYLFHLISEEYAVPGYYYHNKMVFGTIIGFIMYLFTAKAKPIARALIFSAAVSILLQLRYYLEGYPRDFVFIFFGIHFAILVVITIPILLFRKGYKRMHILS